MTELALSNRERTRTTQGPVVLFVDTQPAQRIKKQKLPSYRSWIVRTSGLPRRNVPTINVADGQLLPEDLSNIHGVIYGGSQFSLNDFPNLPWMEKTIQFMDRVQKAGIPQMAICLGHHLAAHKHGGQIETQETKRFGHLFIQPTETGAKEPILDGLSNGFFSSTSNSDLVVALPPSSSGITIAELAQGHDSTGAVHPHEIVVYQMDDIPHSTIHASQFHPELRGQIIAALAKEYNIFASQGRNVSLDRREIWARDAEIQANGQRYMHNWIDNYVIPSMIHRDGY